MDLSFARDIIPLFRDSDIDAMKGFGLDLSSYDEVKENADGIHERLSDGTMPCDAPWDEAQIYKFKQWVDQGKKP